MSELLTTTSDQLRTLSMAFSICAAFFVLFFCSSVAFARDALVDLGYSKYRGQAHSNGIAEWLGMRYAAPPVGQLRFSAPQDPEDTYGVQDATKVSHSITISRPA